MIEIVKGFQKFLLRGNVLDLAVAVVVGAAFTAVVQALTRDIITPIIGVFGGLPDFTTWTFTINGSTFQIGDFINAVIAFVITAAVLYFVIVLPMNALAERRKRGEVPPPAAPSEEVLLLTQIRDALVTNGVPAPRESTEDAATD